MSPITLLATLRARPGALAGLAGLGAAAVLAAALLSQYVGGLAPCPMCLWQRWPHGFGALLGAAGFALGARRGGRAAALLGALVMLVGAGLGLFHAGVEQGWWAGPESCVAGEIGALSTEALIDRIRSAPLVRCDDIPWSFLGLSMAAWNAVLSLGLAALFAGDALRRREADMRGAALRDGPGSPI